MHTYAASGSGAHLQTTFHRHMHSRMADSRTALGCEAEQETAAAASAGAAKAVRGGSP